MADSKRENKMKKKVEARKESSSDSDSSHHDISCNTCDLNFSNVKTYSDHVKGKLHKKNVAQAKHASKLMLSDDDDDKSEDEDNNLKEMYCEICDKHMSGYLSYMAHLKGSLHAKNKKKQKLKEGMAGMPEVLEKESEEDCDKDDLILQDLFARCQICQKTFSGPEPFHMHLKSATHKKKMKQAKALDFLKTKHPEENSVSDEEHPFSKCSVCNKSFSGHVPFQIHMQSNIHKKNMEKMKLVEEFKAFFSDLDNAYVCKECNKKFTDPKNFKHHLNNNSHEKQKAKKALSEFLALNPEIAFLTPFRDPYVKSSEESDNDGSDADYYLVCKLCHASFSGPQSAEDHVKSKRHISLKKNAKVLKILKKQKDKDKESSNVSGGKEDSQNSDSESDEKEHTINNDSASHSTKDEEYHSRRSRVPSENDFEFI